MSLCLIACFLRCISLAFGANYAWGASLPSGLLGKRTPFRFLECDVQGGDANQIQDADAALAWLFSQLPFVSESSPNTRSNPNTIVSLSWPTNMEAQDLFPLASSTYTFPTGTKVDVPCFAPNKVANIERTECPDSFVNSMDLNSTRQCVKVLNGSTRCLHPSIACFSHSPFLAWHSQPCPVAAYTNEEYGRMWAGSNAVGVIGLVLNVYMCMTWSDHHISYLLYHSFSYHPLGHCFLSCLVVQVARRGKSVSSCALSIESVRLLGPPVRHRRNSSVVHYEVWLALL